MNEQSRINHAFQDTHEHHYTSQSPEPLGGWIIVGVRLRHLNNHLKRTYITTHGETLFRNSTNKLKKEVYIFASKTGAQTIADYFNLNATYTRYMIKWLAGYAPGNSYTTIATGDLVR